MHAHDARDAQDSLRCLLAPWRAGGSVGRTLYAIVSQSGPPMAHARDEETVLIGMMDTAQLAEAVVITHNDWLKKNRRRNG
jgi:hypothetical protein